MATFLKDGQYSTYLIFQDVTDCGGAGYIDEATIPPTNLSGLSRPCPSPAAACDCQRRRSGLPCGNRVQDQQGRQVLENAVKVIYDRETDTLSIILRPGKVAESDEPQPGLILDYDKAGGLLSIELLDASEQVQAPQAIEFALAGGA